MLGFVFTVGCGIVGGIYLWKLPKSGKQWMKNLGNNCDIVSL